MGFHVCGHIALKVCPFTIKSSIKEFVKAMSCFRVEKFAARDFNVVCYRPKSVVIIGRSSVVRSLTGELISAYKSFMKST